jgi:hypothetical protein
MVAQMVGKARLALAPRQPEWLNACLYLDGRGFTTGAIPVGSGVVSIGIDVHQSAIRIDLSDGRVAAVPIGPNRAVSSIWADFRSALSGLGIDVDLWDKPQEVSDTTPFGDNTHDCTVEPEQAQRFHRVLCAVDGVLETFRSTFFGRSGLQLWWGGFDLALILFSARRLDPPRDRGFIARYDLDAEHMNAGFWPGDDAAPDPTFWAYLVPRPEGCEAAPVRPLPAAWVEARAEWLLPYERVRTADDPKAAVLEFLDSVYRVAVTNGGWDAEAHRYVGPPPAPRR